MIAILITKGKEYRVAHCFASDIDWAGENESDWKEIILNNFEECEVFTSIKEADEEATKMYLEIMNDGFCPICEYGICILDFEHKMFPNKGE